MGSECPKSCCSQRNEKDHWVLSNFLLAGSLSSEVVNSTNMFAKKPGSIDSNATQAISTFSATNLKKTCLNKSEWHKSQKTKGKRRLRFHPSRLSFLVEKHFSTWLRQSHLKQTSRLHPRRGGSVGRASFKGSGSVQLN